MSSTLPRDPSTGRFIANWVVRGRVIRHIDPARPEPDRRQPGRHLSRRARRVALAVVRRVRQRLP